MIHIIYVPGLGDNSDTLRKKALKFWPFLYKVSVELVPMNWSSETELEPKLQRVNAAIRRAEVDGKNVVLIGESAGAVIALNAYAAGVKLHKLITICGVANPAISIGESFARRAPALPKAVDELRKKNLPKQVGVVHNYRAIFDEVIEPRNTVMPGATEHVLWSFGHLITIGLFLTFYSLLVTRQIKR